MFGQVQEVSVIKTDDGPHPAPAMAAWAASQIVVVEPTASAQDCAEGLRIKCVLQDALEGALQQAQQDYRASIRSSLDRIQEPLSVEHDLVTKVVNAATSVLKGSRFYIVFQTDLAQKRLNEIVARTLLTIYDIERGWRASGR